MPMQERSVREWRLPIQSDFNDLFLGERLGQGATREVFAYALAPRRYVVKVEDHGDSTLSFQNVIAAQIWDAIRDTEWAPWFSPVHWVSPMGAVLIQRRTFPAPSRAKWPERIPEFLADTRDCNWGWLDGRWVVHDYGVTNLLAVGLKRGRMVPHNRKL